MSKWKKVSNCNSDTVIQRLNLLLELEITKTSPDPHIMRLLKRGLAKAHNDDEVY